MLHAGRRGVVKTPKKFLGKWRIVKTEVWGRDARDLIVPAHLTFDAAGLGHFQMIAVEGELDCRFEGDRVEFSWRGQDDRDPASGRGWAEVTVKGTLEGRIFSHQADDSGFVAKRE